VRGIAVSFEVVEKEEMRRHRDDKATRKKVVNGSASGKKGRLEKKGMSGGATLLVLLWGVGSAVCVSPSLQYCTVPLVQS
jgi:hypothetical protein